MSHRLAVSLLLSLMLCGISGCRTARSLIAAELDVTDINRRVGDLEAQNSSLQQQVDQLKHDATKQNKKVATLMDMSNTINAQIAQATAEADSIKDSIEELDDEIDRLSKAELGPEEKAEYRKEKLADITRQRDEQRARLTTSRKILKRFQKTVEDTQERLASQ